VAQGRADVGVSIQTICVAGAESTGKSWLANRLAAHYAVVPVTEYARSYCAKYGNNLSMEQLVHIGQVQDSNIRGRVADGRRGERRQAIVIADTDAVVTAAWALAGHGHLDPWFEQSLFAFDLTLVTENDLPWRDDGVRIQRDDGARGRFRALLAQELDRRNRPWVSVGGRGEARFDNALQQITAYIQRMAG
jgi:NadR type nicotinamide-nucleotide adenylyltransferase